MAWHLRKVPGGTELIVQRIPGLASFASLGRRGNAGRQLDRRLQLLPQIASLKIAVVGGGTGLYTTLLGLRDRTWNLTAVISGLPPAVTGRDPKDHLGSLPRNDASLCLVALAPTQEENVALRSLLGHRMERNGWRGEHFGTALLAALEETRGSRQAALGAAVALLGIHGRIALALGSPALSTREGAPADGAIRALLEADMIVVAPGHLELDLLPVLCCPGIIDAIKQSDALKVVVTKMMTAEDAQEVATTSHQAGALAALIGTRFDVVLANAGPFTPGQLRLYAAAGAYPIRPDVEATLPYTEQLLAEQLGARGDLARHDPEQLGESLVEIGAQHLLQALEAGAQGA